MKQILTILFAALIQFASGQIASLPSEKLDVMQLQNNILTSLRNKQVKLDQPGNLNLIIFLSPECPLSVNYTLALNEIKSNFGSRLSMVGIISGKTYSLKDVKKFSKDYKLLFALLIDREMNVSRQVKATVTPEVLLYNEFGEIKYRGAIDDWAVSLGKKKQKASNLYLHNAIQQSLLGEEITLKKTNPVGCLINDY